MGPRAARDTAPRNARRTLVGAPVGPRRVAAPVPLGKSRGRAGAPARLLRLARTSALRCAAVSSSTEIRTRRRGARPRCLRSQADSSRPALVEQDAEAPVRWGAADVEGLDFCLSAHRARAEWGRRRSYKSGGETRIERRDDVVRRKAQAAEAVRARPSSGDVAGGQILTGPEMLTPVLDPANAPYATALPGSPLAPGSP